MLKDAIKKILAMIYVIKNAIIWIATLITITPSVILVNLG